MTDFFADAKNLLRLEYGVRPEEASVQQVYHAVSKAAIARARSTAEPAKGKRACYFSAEFLIGKLIYDNLLNLGLTKDADQFTEETGLEFSVFEQMEDAALGNGGLGRLAACFLDSAATHGIPLDGYGIRYRYGLFRQTLREREQGELADDWLQFGGDPWSVRRDDQFEKVDFADFSVRAVPYDMPVIGYGGKCINRLRLWQAESFVEFDFESFNRGDEQSAYRRRLQAERISALLYPNDESYEGKRLRLMQQYFFVSASLQSIVRTFKRQHGTHYEKLPEFYAVQLNDTHPVLAIPELIRLMCTDGLPFEQAFSIAFEVFAYTNHTVLAEALERWDVGLVMTTVPQVYDYIVLIDSHLREHLLEQGVDPGEFRIIDGGTIHMARLAVYASHSTNGVARLHTDILKESLLKRWYDLWPERFSNKTNGITQRRWLNLSNPELAGFITERIGDGWITDLSKISALAPSADDTPSLERFLQIKQSCKNRLREVVSKRENFELHEHFLFDVQIKRLHEYKRQLMNALSIADIYKGIISGRITEFNPTAFIFGAKAAPGYRQAKSIIKFICRLADVINSDERVKDKMQVLYIANYNVSWAQVIIPAAELSEQISTAGMEASGTGNMKLMLNGAPTLGTYDGANIEIVEQAGEENNYIFGAKAHEIEELRGNYRPRSIYDGSERVRTAVDTLIDGTVSDGGTGEFAGLHYSLLEEDRFFVLHDFEDYCQTRLRAINESADRLAFARKALGNIAAAGIFSSDRTVRQYAEEIWHNA